MRTGMEISTHLPVPHAIKQKIHAGDSSTPVILIIICLVDQNHRANLPSVGEGSLYDILSPIIDPFIAGRVWFMCNSNAFRSSYAPCHLGLIEMIKCNCG